MKICWFTVNKKKRCSCLNNFQIIQKMCTKKMGVYDTVLEKNTILFFLKEPSLVTIILISPWSGLDCMNSKRHGWP